jgi:class 3 adenylate cyclase/tetratricopeptide (TPR) repeat protein
MSSSRRLAAILAADVVGFSSLMGDDEDGTFASLQALRSVVDPMLAGHGGRIANTAGDSIIAEFSSVAQAVDAAVEIQRSVEAHATGLRLRVGINLGDVIVTEDGDVFGDGVNIAARLEGMAPPGGIVIAASVRDSLRGRSPVAFDDLGAQRLKNIEEPIRVFRARLEAPLAAAPAMPAPESGLQLLERTEELGVLQDAFDAAGEGRGNVIIVDGEAGIGKSALLREFSASISPPVEVAWGWCDDLVTPRPLGPFRDMAPALGPEFARAISGDSSPDAILQSLHSALASGTRMLVIEDLHWADDATLDAITFLVRRIDRLPVMLAITTRHEGLARSRATTADAAPGAVKRILLSPLSARAIAELSGDAATAETMRRLTGGNPFFVSEMLAAGDGTIPLSVQDAVLARLDRLSEEARSVAHLVSVAPTRLEIELVERIMPGSGAAVDEAEAATILMVMPEGIGYRHELARRAVEDSMPIRARQALHRQVLAELVATGSDPARLVHHAEAAGDIDSTIRHALAAAAAAAAAGAHREAAAHYERILSHDHQLDDETLEKALQAFSHESYLLDREGPAITAAERLLEIHKAADAPTSVGDDLRWLSRLYWWQGRGSPARAAADEAIETLEKLGRSRELAMAYSNRAQLAMLAGDDPTAIEWGTKALTLSEELGDEETAVHALINLATTGVRHFTEEDSADLIQARERARAAGFTESTCRAWTNLSWSLLYDRRYELAEQELLGLLAYTEEHEIEFFRSYTLGQLSLLTLETGRWQEAADYARSSFEGRAFSNVGKVPALQVRSLLAARQSRLDEAEEIASEAWLLAERSDEMQRLGPIASVRCELAWLRGDETSIPGIALPVLERSRAIADTRHLGEMGRWLRFAGVETSEDENQELPYLLESRGEHAAAAVEWQRLGAPYDSAIALFLSGRVDDAADILQTLGARATLRRIGR